jgi:hypothetical protein
MALEGTQDLRMASSGVRNYQFFPYPQVPIFSTGNIGTYRRGRCAGLLPALDVSY